MAYHFEAFLEANLNHKKNSSLLVSISKYIKLLFLTINYKNRYISRTEQDTDLILQKLESSYKIIQEYEKKNWVIFWSIIHCTEPY